MNLSGGKTRDGGSIVGASVFYSDVPGPESPKKKIGSQSSLEKLDQELKVHKHSLPVSLSATCSYRNTHSHTHSVSCSMSCVVCRTSRRSCGSRTSFRRWFGSVLAPSPPLKLSSLTPTSLETSWRASLCVTLMSSASPVYQVSR